MLPDFPKLKEKLQKVHLGTMEKDVLAYMGPFSDTPPYYIHEGDRWILVREDGSVEEIELKRTGVEIKVDPKEIENATPDSVLAKYAAAAEDSARQRFEHFYSKIANAANEAGNVIDADGNTFCIDHLFWALDKMQIDFGRDGKPKMPTIWAGEDAFKLLSKAISESQMNQEHKERFDELMERKREEWRVRESNRKLVG